MRCSPPKLRAENQEPTRLSVLGPVSQRRWSMSAPHTAHPAA